MNLYPLLKSIAFKFDPEKVHDIAISSFSRNPHLAYTLPRVTKNPKFQVISSNLNWSFPVGLAAGLDKNAMAIDFFNNLGFGSVEIGTVTPRAQIGNEKPRIWRIAEENSLRNAMGFPNAGMDRINKFLIKHNPEKISIGVNIGKNKASEHESILNDYSKLLAWADQVSSYIVVNISSPNTPGLRDLQGEEFIRDLSSIRKKLNIKKPVFIKLAPDMSKEALQKLCELIIDYDYQGIVATNTTRIPQMGNGGVSGQLLKVKAKEVRQSILEVVNHANDFDFIGVGGIDRFEDLLEFWKSGGKFTQIYTSFIYQGPQILKDFQKGIEAQFFKYRCQDMEELFQALQN